jgi:hypothetical protein
MITLDAAAVPLFETCTVMDSVLPAPETALGAPAVKNAVCANKELPASRTNGTTIYSFRCFKK